MENSQRLELLRTQYLEMVNQKLPDQAKHRNFPVFLNHCFGRIILDNLFGRCWYEVLDKKRGPAYRQLSEEQLEMALAIARAIIENPDAYIRELDRQSLRWRGKSV